MNKVKITAVKQVEHRDLSALYENPIQHACNIKIGQTFISERGKIPPGFCKSAWKNIEEWVVALANGESHFYGNWMKNPYTAMISCNDGFRPVIFYLEVIE